MMGIIRIYESGLGFNFLYKTEFEIVDRIDLRWLF